MFFSRVRKIDTAGTITTIAGTGLAGYSGDEGQATAAKINPWGIGIDNFDNLYIADGGAYIRKIDLSTGIITTVVGYGSAIYNGDGIQATSAGVAPVKMAFDLNNNMYIGDDYNNRIRMVDTGGIIHTIAGTGVQGFSGDGGPATDATLYYPSGVEYYCGNIYFADVQNARVREVIYNTSGSCPRLGSTNLIQLEIITLSPNPHHHFPPAHHRNHHHQPIRAGSIHKLLP